mgnify:CR=1 FL=1
MSEAKSKANMLHTLHYKRNLDEVLERLCALYARRTSDRILASFQVPSRALRTFAIEHAEGFCDYPDPEERIRFWDAFLAERRDLEDDSIPCAYLSEFDQGLYGGLLGGEVQFMCHPENGWISSMVPPLLQDWSAFDILAFNTTHPWWQRYQRQLRVFVEGAEGRFGISHFILINGLNLVFELLGATRTYLSLIERPEMVERAIEMAYALNLTVQRAFFETVPSLRGGTCSNMVQWMPGRIVSESVDPFHMTSVDYFERWGRAPVERILGQFDGGVLHIHGNGRHLLEAVATVRGLKAIYLGDDRAFPPAFEILGELRQRVGDIPLVVGMPWGPFVEALARHELVGGVFYQVSDAPSVAEANRIMERVRVYRT